MKPEGFVKTAFLDQQGTPQSCWVFSEGPHIHASKMNLWKRDRDPLGPDQVHGLLGYQGFRYYQEKPKTHRGLNFAPESSCSFIVNKYKANSREFLRRKSSSLGYLVAR